MIGLARSAWKFIVGLRIIAGNNHALASVATLFWQEAFGELPIEVALVTSQIQDQSVSDVSGAMPC